MYIAKWNKHTFEVKPKLIRGFTDLAITGACETEDKNTGQSKYVARKYADIPQITLTVHLNALTGVEDGYKKAMEYKEEAMAGASDYFLLSGKKVFPSKMMLTKAEITQVVTMPKSGKKWISCDVKLTLKQGEAAAGEGTGSGGSGNGSGGGNTPPRLTMMQQAVATMNNPNASNAVTTIAQQVLNHAANLNNAVGGPSVQDIVNTAFGNGNNNSGNSSGSGSMTGTTNASGQQLQGPVNPAAVAAAAAAAAGAASAAGQQGSGNTSLTQGAQGTTHLNSAVGRTGGGTTAGSNTVNPAGGN